MSRSYIEALKKHEPAHAHRAVLESMFGARRTAGDSSDIAVVPNTEAVNWRPEDPDAVLSAKVSELEAERRRYLAAIETLNAHLEEHPHDPIEMVELAVVVAEAIVGRAFTMDHTLVVDRVTEALDALDGERPTRLRLSPVDRKLLADERPDLLARALEIVEDPKMAPGGCIVEGAKRGVDATLEDRLQRFTRTLKQRLAEENRDE